MDRFEAMTAFVAVADRNGFAPAARALGASPSTVTRLVGGLEARLGVRLLDRTTRAVRLTDPGARFLERARRILADLDEAERLAEDERAAPTGRLALAAPVVFGRLYVAPLVGAYMARYPGVTVELDLNDRNVNLIEEGVDLAVRIGDLADTGLVARRAGVTRRVLAATPAYLAANGAPVTPADLAAHRIIGVTTLGPVDRLRLSGGDAFVAPAFVTNSIDAAIWHAANDGGLVQVLSYQIADHLRACRLRIVMSDHEPPPLPIQFVHPARGSSPSRSAR